MKIINRSKIAEHEERFGVSDDDIGPIFDETETDLDIDVIVASVRHSNGKRAIDCKLSLSNGKMADFTIEVDGNFGPMLINQRIRIEARITAYTTWGVTPSQGSRVVIFGGAT